MAPYRPATDPAASTSRFFAAKNTAANRSIPPQENRRSSRSKQNMAGSSSTAT